jgi:hypothetical protein
MEMISMDTLIVKIMNFAQRLVDADRASLFLVDAKTNQLYARIFDITGKSTDAPDGEHDVSNEIRREYAQLLENAQLNTSLVNVQQHSRMQRCGRSHRNIMPRHSLQGFVSNPLRQRRLLYSTTDYPVLASRLFSSHIGVSSSECVANSVPCIYHLEHATGAREVLFARISA